MSSYSLDALAAFLDQARRRYGGSMMDRLPYRETAHRFIAESPDSFENARRGKLWAMLQDIKEHGETVSGIVTGWNRGGLLVRWEDLQGFVPASQLREVPVFDSDSARDEMLSRWVGEELALKVIELDPNRNRLVFSERAALWGPRQGEQLLAELREGETRDGAVSNVCDFGVFVDLGGVDGLIHISELSWGRVAHPSHLLRIGDRVQVYVLSVDRTTHHVGLSLKRLRPNPWSLAETRYAVGDVVEATVTNIVDFGVFVQLEEGLEGLVHISEMSDLRVYHPRQLVQLLDRVQVRILRIEADQHRLSLSMKQAQEQAPPDESDDEYGDSSEDGDQPDVLLY